LRDAALNQAALNENIDLVEAYLLEGVDPNWKSTLPNNFQNSSLHQSIFRGNSEIASLLISNGADVEIENQLGNTPLMFAAYYGHIDIVKMLVKNGANVNAFSTKTGYTALGKACMQGHEGVVQFLLENGAYSYTLDREGHTPQEVIGISGERRVSSQEETEILKLLSTKGLRLYSKCHHHELAVVLGMFAGPVSTCSLCQSPLLPENSQYMCPSDGFKLCHNCYVISNKGYSTIENESCGEFPSCLKLFCL